jgi:hypothetical protein
MGSLATRKELNWLARKDESALPFFCGMQSRISIPQTELSLLVLGSPREL